MSQILGELENENEAPHPGTKMTFRGVICKPFPETHKIDRNTHKVPLGTINPIH